MAGFWAGFAKGYTNAKERQLEREKWLAASGSKAKDRLMSRRRELLEQLSERVESDRELAQRRAAIARTFESRLKNVPLEERQAFISIVSSNPDFGESLLEQIQRQEEQTKGVELRDEQLLEAVPLIEETRPEGMTRDEWMEETVRRIYEFQSGDSPYQNLYESILGADSVEELPVTIPETNPTPDMGLGLPDIDVGEVRGQPPTEQQNWQELFQERVRNRVSTQLSRLRTLQEELQQNEQPIPDYLSNQYNLFRHYDQAIQSDDYTPALDRFGPEIAQELYEQSPDFGSSSIAQQYLNKEPIVITPPDYTTDVFDTQPPPVVEPDEEELPPGRSRGR